MKLVLVEWGDICSTSDPMWQHRESICDLNTISCITAGLLLEETDIDIRVVLSSNPGSFSQEITIPKSCIRRIRTLKVV